MYVNSAAGMTAVDGRPPIPPTRPVGHLKQEERIITPGSSPEHTPTKCRVVPIHVNSAPRTLRSPTPEICTPLQKPKPHVLHRNCRLNLATQAASNSASFIDVVIVHSSKCQISTDWALYIRSLLLNTLSRMKHGFPEGFPHVARQDVETFSNCMK